MAKFAIPIAKFQFSYLSFEFFPSLDFVCSFSSLRSDITHSRIVCVIVGRAVYSSCLELLAGIALRDQ